MSGAIKPDEIGRIASLLTSDLIVADYLGDIEIDGYKGLTKLDASALKADAPADAKAQRFDLITAAKAGKHIELQVVAQTFAQTKKHNRRYLRLADDHLEAAAPTWKGQPYLKDHTTWAMSSQMGTLISSKAEPISGGMAFMQKLHATATESVIGILDGRWGKFSIGWFYEGPILCSVHDCDILKGDSCGCWPGDKVMLDGRERVVEFVFTKYSGKETSSVVIPAVQDTHVGDVKAALAAELGITDRLTRRPTVAVPINVKEKNPMKLFHRLAVALGLTALSEENEHGEAQVLAAVEALRQRAVTAETKLATTEGKLTQAETAVSTLTAASVGMQIDAALQADGYKAGKLKYGQDAEGKRTPSPLESFLRDIGTKGGIAVLKAQLGAMPVIVAVGQRPQSEIVATPALTVIGENDETGLTEDNPYLRNAAEQTGQKVGDLVAFAKGHISQEAR